MATVDDLLAREEIEAALNRYVRGVDRLDRELMLSSYHPDGYDDHGAFRGTAADFVDYVCGNRSRRYRMTMHFLGPANIKRQADLAYVDTYCIAHHLSHFDDQGFGTNIVMGLRYVDRFERRIGRWLIAHRSCIYDWTQTYILDPSETRPLGANWLLGRRDREDPWYMLQDTEDCGIARRRGGLEVDDAPEVDGPPRPSV